MDSNLYLFSFTFTSIFFSVSAVAALQYYDSASRLS